MITNGNHWCLKKLVGEIFFDTIIPAIDVIDISRSKLVWYFFVIFLLSIIINDD